MRRIALAIMGTVSGLVMLFSYRTSTNSGAAPPRAAGPGTTASATGPAGATAAPGGSAGAPSASAGTGTTSSGTAASGTYTGAAAQTYWGTVQVQITVQNGRITAAQAVQYPQNNPRDVEINAYAVPQLDQEAVQSQSGSIDAVSGATVTSDGYIQSLQSAIDLAHR
jgi:uncharacterized protein with FMN-binding domain